MEGSDRHLRHPLPIGILLSHLPVNEKKARQHKMPAKKELNGKVPTSSM